MDNPGQQWSDWRQQIIGLGDQSSRKSYYPELQKRLEELRASEADLRTLFDSVTDAIFIHDDQGRVEDVNQTMLDMYRVTREQAVAFGIADYSEPGPQTARLPEILAGLHGASTRVLFEWKARRPLDGTVFDVEVALHATRWRNRAMIVAVVRDISERKQAELRQRKLEQQLMQAQKMESVGRLAGGVAHDFNNMLQSILGNVELALEDLPPGHALRECLDEIQRSAQRSAELTRQLLAFARKQTISPKVLDLNETVAGMLKMLRRLIGEDIELAWLPGTGLWPVMLDPSQVDQVLANLCVNARDAIADAGRITIETANVAFDDTYAAAHPECAPGDYVLLAVTDNGCGMDAATRAHLFEPFFTTKELGKGTGLGLATVFGIVKQNRGQINVYSEPGRGTTFKLYLPRAESPAPAAEPARTRRSPGGTETLLLVEDEEQILALGQRILQRLGYTVLAARNPEEALRLIEHYGAPIHLLITDVVMPGLNGRQLHERLRALQPGLKCLYMSGYTANVIAHQGILEAGVHFLQKPFTSESVGLRIREVLDSP